MLKWLKKKVCKCEHEYHEVNCYEVEYINWRTGESSNSVRYDMYCPICNEVVTNISKRDIERELNIQKVKSEHLVKNNIQVDQGL